MSYYEAIEDGIPFDYDSKGFKVYYPPCHVCGAGVGNWSYKRNVKYTCRECREILADYELDKKDEQDYTKKEKKLQEALRRISKVADIEKYQGAIKAVKKTLDKRGWYQSTEEIMTALELLHRGLKVYHQVRIYEYKADFVLPDLKVVLEIDGKPYHPRENRRTQAMRDELIQMKFGEGWEVIRIDTENTNTNITRLLPAIKAVKKQRQNKNRR